MKVYYFNDERKDVVVRVLDATYDESVGPKDSDYTDLKACQGTLFDVQLPDNSVLHIKKWPHMVMLSYIDQSAFAQSAEVQQHQDAETSGISQHSDDSED